MRKHRCETFQRQIRNLDSVRDEETNDPKRAISIAIIQSDKRLVVEPFKSCVYRILIRYRESRPTGSMMMRSPHSANTKRFIYIFHFRSISRTTFPFFLICRTPRRRWHTMLCQQCFLHVDFPHGLSSNKLWCWFDILIYHERILYANMCVLLLCAAAFSFPIHIDIILQSHNSRILRRAMEDSFVCWAFVEPHRGAGNRVCRSRSLQLTCVALPVPHFYGQSCEQLSIRRLEALTVFSTKMYHRLRAKALCLYMWISKSLFMLHKWMSMLLVNGRYLIFAYFMSDYDIFRPNTQ